jgi:hypothetical protein
MRTPAVLAQHVAAGRAALRDADAATAGAAGARADCDAAGGAADGSRLLGTHPGHLQRTRAKRRGCRPGSRSTGVVLDAVVVEDAGDGHGSLLSRRGLGGPGRADEEFLGAAWGRALIWRSRCPAASDSAMECAPEPAGARPTPRRGRVASSSALAASRGHLHTFPAGEDPDSMQALVRVPGRSRSPDPRARCGWAAPRSGACDRAETGARPVPTMLVLTRASRRPGPRTGRRP